MRTAYGGVVVNRAGLVLLREPAGHFLGYVWTFAKGGADPGESPEAAAVREVLEETGVQARVLAPLGRFSGRTPATDNDFYLMEAESDVLQPFDSLETASVAWVSWEEAARRIRLSDNIFGRERDLVILARARALYRQFREGIAS